MSLNTNLTGICNMALSRMGEPPIQNVNDGSPVSNICSIWLSQCIQEVGRSTRWNCLSKRQNLGRDSTYGKLNPCSPQVTQASIGSFPWWSPGAGPCSPFCPPLLYEWSSRFQLPADFIRALELNGVDCWDNFNGDKFEIYGRFLYTDERFCDLKYVAYTEDATLYDSAFIGALYMMLAARIATPIRKDDGQLAAQLEEIYQMESLPTARRLNGNEGHRRRYDPGTQSKFIRSRWGSTNG